MNPSAAFAGGSGLAMGSLATLVAGVGTTIVLLWAGWAWLSTWRGWAGGRVRGPVFQGAIIRIALLAVLMFWIFLG
ncbi:MAG: TIGR03758 family integrating conjugative element protein [Salinisphaera sp.]|jgi:integrating conjugative element protein (TIGR03758 family)|nr:TIGR03758 family integrating conjugative element protein [Salinisphaera sp.]